MGKTTRDAVTSVAVLAIILETLFPTNAIASSTPTSSLRQGAASYHLHPPTRTRKPRVKGFTVLTNVLSEPPWPSFLANLKSFFIDLRLVGSSRRTETTLGSIARTYKPALE